MSGSDVALNSVPIDSLIRIPPPKRATSIAAYSAELVYCGFLVLCIGGATSKFSPILVLLGLVYPTYLLYGLSIELLSCEFVRIDRYTIELERKLLGFSVSSEVFKTDAVGRARWRDPQLDRQKAGEQRWPDPVRRRRGFVLARGWTFG